MQYENIYFFQFLGVLCTQGPQTSAKNPNLSVKNWGKKSISQKPNLNHQFIQFYFQNHKFNVFKRFWKQKKNFFYPASKSLIKAQFGGKNRFLGILAPFSPRLRDLGVIIVGINEAYVHTYFGHFFLVLSGFWADFGFRPFLALVPKNCRFWPKPAKIWPDGYSYVHYH